MDFHIEAKLTEIENDSERGASQLAAMGIDLLKEAGLVLSFEGKGREEIIFEIVKLAARLDSARPSMAALGAWAAVFCLRLREKIRKDAESSAESALEEVAEDLCEEKESLLAKQIESAKPALRSVSGIITLSYSSTVERILIEAAPENCLITVAESRPRMEGRKLCLKLLEASRNVRLITDAQMGLAMKEADMAIIGADTICSDLAVINKSGSLLLALAAKEAGKLFFVAADTFKISPSVTANNAPLEEKPGAEVWEEKGGICSNVYFEPVPSDLITGFLTEKGLISHDEMKEEVEKWRVLRKKIYEKSGGNFY